MKLKQALKVVNETKINMVIEVSEGHFESKTLNYLAAHEESFREAIEFASKWSEKKVTFIKFNKVKEVIEIACYMI